MILETRFLWLRLYVGQLVEQPDTAVPSKDGVIVVRGADLFCFFKMKHCLLEQRHEQMRRPSRAHLGLGPPFIEEPLIIVALVRISEIFEE